MPTTSVPAVYLSAGDRVVLPGREAPVMTVDHVGRAQQRPEGGAARLVYGRVDGRSTHLSVPAPHGSVSRLAR